MNQIKVSAKRHLAKTISYRVISTMVGFLIMWTATGSIEFGAAFGIAELLYKPIQYYIHERIWYKWIKFGVIKDSEKKKKNSILTEDKAIPQKKETHEEDNLSEPQPSPKPSLSSEFIAKKVLSYNSKR